LAADSSGALRQSYWAQAAAFFKTKSGVSGGEDIQYSHREQIMNFDRSTLQVTLQTVQETPVFRS
jgi:hypothetical protein